MTILVKIAIGMLLTITLVQGFQASQSKIEDAERPLLAADKNVFVEKAEHEVDVAMIGELKKWNRWKIVADESEADLLIRLRVSGSAAWGIGHVQASILDAKTKKTLYTSKDQRGTRSIFHGYARLIGGLLAG